MNSTMKLVLGVVLGYAGYMAYKKLKSTQTVFVNTFDTQMPSIVGASMISDQVAGLRGMRGWR